VARARAGRLRLVGDGRNKVDTTYIDNAAQAHFDALEHLAPGASCAGKATLSPTASRWRWAICSTLCSPPARRRYARRLRSRRRTASVRCARRAVAWLPLKGEPPITRFSEQLCTPHWYSMEPARRDFGYVPQVLKIKEGLRRLRENALQLVDALK
jgi:nucleoside-diphosphate-sugar epimerase